MSTATYVYCIVKSAKRPDPGSAPPGVPGERQTDAIRVSPSVHLITSAVPLDRYSGPQLEASLADLEQVGPIALAHEAMVEHFARTPDLTVVPMKLFTLFSSPARAVADVAARRKEIDAAFRRIAGAEEWGVRITRADVPAPRAAAPNAVSSGKAFLSAKKQARDEVVAAKLSAATAASETFTALARLAKAARIRDDRVSSTVAPPLLEAAFLVRVAERAKFRAAVRRHAAACARSGAALVLTGPWPAYNFVAAEPTV